MKMKQICIATATAIILGCMPAHAANVVNAYAVDELTSDMALVYMGSSSRPVWNQSALKSLVVHTYADGSKPTWMFDSFLFLEFSIDGRHLDNKNGGESSAATQAQWENLFKSQMSINNKGEGMKVLDDMIGTLKNTLGEPAIKHKIVMQLPTPQTNQTNWGSVDGHKLDFHSADDMQTAMRWAVDKILELWEQCAFKNLDLVGVYCIDESMNLVADRFREISSYLHEKGLKLYWIPYYSNNPSKNLWAENGVDVAYQQPNYYFDKNIYKTQLRGAIDDAKKYGLGLELEFHPDGLWNYQRKSDETDMTVPSKASYYNRLKDYIDEFEAKGVFDESAVAYYSGNDGFAKFAASKTPEDLAIMDRLAHIIDNRHKKLAAIDNIHADDTAETFAVAATGCIHVPDTAPLTRIYSVNGALLHSGPGTFPCQPGLYIAADGRGHSVKLAVR